MTILISKTIDFDLSRLEAKKCVKTSRAAETAVERDLPGQSLFWEIHKGLDMAILGGVQNLRHLGKENSKAGCQALKQGK